MSQKDQKSIYSPITYVPQKDVSLIFFLIAITVFYVFIFTYWTNLAYNLLIVGYFIFKEMRYAVLIYAIIIRIIMYPFGMLRKKMKAKTDIAEEEFAEQVTIEKHPVSKDKAKRKWLRKYKKILIFEWFAFCFYTINALSVGWIFLNDLSPEIVNPQLWFDFLIPVYPLNTTGYIPLVGMVDLTKVSLRLNLYSAIGAGLVGLAEVIINRKTNKKQLIMYLIMFPLGAYFITMWVPAGFEYALVIIEILTILIIIAEKMVEFSQKLFSPPKKEVDEPKVEVAQN